MTGTLLARVHTIYDGTKSAVDNVFEYDPLCANAGEPTVRRWTDSEELSCPC